MHDTPALSISVKSVKQILLISFNFLSLTIAENRLSAVCLSKIPDIKPKDNYHKKIGQLNHHNIISPTEYDVLKKLGDIRNNLVHGKYEKVEMNDIKGSFYIINEFIDNHYLN